MMHSFFSSLNAAPAGCGHDYCENFSSYAEDTSLATNPPNYTSIGPTGGTAVVKSYATWGQNAAKINCGAAGFGWWKYNGKTWTDIDVSIRCSCDMTHAANRTNFSIRGDGAGGDYGCQNGYMIQLIPNYADYTQLYKVVAGVITQIGTSATSTVTATDYTVRIIALGTSIKVYVDGSLKINETDSTYTGAGNLAMGGWTSSADYPKYFSNIIVN